MLILRQPCIHFLRCIMLAVYWNYYLYEYGLKNVLSVEKHYLIENKIWIGRTILRVKSLETFFSIVIHYIL